MTRPDDPAFASEDNRGMTIREFYAGLIMAHLSRDHLGRPVADASLAVHRADALIEKLNGPVRPRPAA